MKRQKIGLVTKSVSSMTTSWFAVIVKWHQKIRKTTPFFIPRKKNIPHFFIGVKFWYVILGILMRRFAVKNLLLQLFWGYPKNDHQITELLIVSYHEDTGWWSTDTTWNNIATVASRWPGVVEYIRRRYIWWCLWDTKTGYCMEPFNWRSLQTPIWLMMVTSMVTLD